MELPAKNTPLRAAGMKRQREQCVSWSDRDADGDRRMDSDADDASMCSNGSARHLDDASSDTEEEPTRKRAMLIKANLRFLEKLPTLRDYQRSRNGRRGAIDGGALTGAMMMAALEESFEETSFVTLEPPAREAMVAPAPAPPPVHMTPSDILRRGSSAQESQRIRPATVRPAMSSAKDDEARPASE